MIERCMCGAEDCNRCFPGRALVKVDLRYTSYEEEQQYRQEVLNLHIHKCKFCDDTWNCYEWECDIAEEYECDRCTIKIMSGWY